MHRHGHIAALLGVALLAACGDKVDRTVTGPQPTAGIKFFNFALNAPQVNFFADETKMTAISSATGTESTLGTGYGAAAAGGLYVNSTAGQHDFTGRISATTDKNLAISKVTQTVESGKRYSYYQSGFYNTTTKQADAFIVEDNFTVPTDSMVHVRFINVSPNAGTVPLTVMTQATDSTVTAIGAPQPYKGATPFVEIPPGVYDATVRGTRGTTAVSFTRTGLSFVRAHVYTITLRGDWTVTSTTSGNRPIIESFSNY